MSKIRSPYTPTFSYLENEPSNIFMSQPDGDSVRLAQLTNDSSATVTKVAGVSDADRIRRAITSAKGNNAVELEPWLLPPLWALSTTYYAGQIIRNAAGNAYMRLPTQVGGVVSTGTEPVHQTQVPTLDGAAGNYWMYLGKARGLAAGNYNSATPAAATDTMTGHMAICSRFGPPAVEATLGLTRILGEEFTVANFPARLIGLRDVSAPEVYPMMLGPNTGTVAAPNYTASSIHYGIHFKTNSRWIWLRPAAPIGTQASGGDNVSIEVNGRRISDSTFIKTNAEDGSNGRLMDLSKYPGTEKDVKIFGKNLLRSDIIYSVHLEPTAYMLPGEVTNEFKISFEGDSLSSGGAGLPTHEGDMWTLNTARLLGASSWYNNAVGATGFIAPGNGTLTTYIQRIDRINLFAPDVHVVMGGHNDGLLTSAARQAAVLLYMQTFRAANPNAFLFMFGNLLMKGDTVATYQTAELDIQAAVTTFNDARTKFIPILTDPKGSWYAGGSVNGNYFYHTGTAPFDDTHHTIGAYKMLEHQVATAIRNYFAA